MIITLDFETSDPFIDRGLGSGWCYPKHPTEKNFEVLGFSAKLDSGESTYVSMKDGGESTLLHVLCYGDVDLLIMHNAAYDLGCLEYLGINTSKLVVYDTMVAAKLYDSSLMSYSLDNLANKYLGYQKGNDILAGAVLKEDIYPHTKKYLNEMKQWQSEQESFSVNRELPKIDISKVIKWCKANMDIVQQHCPEAMAEYARIDTDLTYKLYEFYKDKVDIELVKKYSMLSKITNSYRKKGVRVDLDAARKSLLFLDIEINKAEAILYETARQRFNINSNKEVPAVLHEAGLSPPRTKIGNYSATAGWLESQDHPLCQQIVEVRKLQKVKNDFIQKIIEMQEFTCPGAEKYGRIFPELNLLRAVTGRFSCSSPNLQQIPSRDEKLAPLCKSIFVPEENEYIFSLDFSNQEGRLQVHYAYMLECEGSTELKIRFNNDPNFDMHQAVADMAGITRRQAKTINLGLSYGMGNQKLAKSLDLSEESAKLLRDKYESMAPFLSDLKTKCESSIKQKGTIRTIGGRELKLDPPMFIDGKRRTFEYKALNKLIQGSAADQTIECMIQAYNENIPVLFPVHDQLLMSGTKEQAIRLKEIMENAIPLCIPVVVDVNLEGGESWLTAGH